MTALVIIIFNGDNSIFDYGGVGGVVMIDGVPSEGAGITAAAFAKIYFIFRTIPNRCCSAFCYFNYDFLVILWFTVMDVYFWKK